MNKSTAAALRLDPAETRLGAIVPPNSEADDGLVPPQARPLLNPVVKRTASSSITGKRKPPEA
ncbi:MAG: hypothetical protein VYD81_09590 [Planctomycetota bacterium]|nr:hypothetical protein [Planctomycetota bacterium]